MIPSGTYARVPLCQEMDPKVLDGTFFYPGPAYPHKRPSPISLKHWAKAKAVCAQCPVLARCREQFLGERWGVWGGMDEHERHLERRRRAEAAAAAREAIGWTEGGSDEAV